MMSTRKQSILAQFAVVALILATTAVYLPPFIRSFVGDDYIQFDYVKQFVQNPATIWGVFNPFEVPWYYRPTQNLWFWINRLILGREPFGYYIIMLWLHALTIALIYRVARQFKLGLFAAVCTAVLFAIHSHWVDVVTWISSAAIVMGAIFSLLSVSGMLAYLRRPSTRQLSLVFILTLLTLLTHEEAILLPPMLFLLLIMWRLESRRLKFGNRRLKRKRKRAKQSLISNLQSLISQRELLVFGLMAGLTAAYLIITFSRPNPTLQVSERTIAEWLTFLRWPEMAEFLLVTLFRFTFIFPILDLASTAANLFLLGLGIVIAVWFWRGSWVVRWGLLWTAVHLFFIYWALWTQLPSLYAGRHIYQTGIGLTLAIGGTIDMIVGRDWRLEIGRLYVNLQSPISNLLIILLLGLLIIHHINQTHNTQQAWLANVTEEETAKTQLFDLFPELTAENHIFAYRFPIAPQFMRSVAQIWYGVPLQRPGGSIEHLRAYGRAAPEFIVLDYEEGQVYDLMPELRDYPETTFLWAADDREVVVANSTNGRQLAISLTPKTGEWTGKKYTVEIPDNGELHTAVLAQPHIAYRLRIGDEIQPLFTQDALAAGKEMTWVEVKIPLSGEAGEEIEVWLEVTAVIEIDQLAYWANPRIVVSPR
ncbi:MAG: hypothetical protein GY796_12940 [Chloroflexi bacterium]|nr:hypothetical protein [Chloroflexota bacterium]